MVPFGFLVGAVVATQLFVLLRRTRFGFEVAVIADSAPTARYAGMRTRRTILAVMALSGAVAGLGGASNVGDTRHVLDPRGLSQAGYGYAGIVVAALARLNPVAVVLTSMVMGGLANAGRALAGPRLPGGPGRHPAGAPAGLHPRGRGLRPVPHPTRRHRRRAGATAEAAT